MKKRCVVCLATDDFNFARNRLANSLIQPNIWSGDFILFKSEDEVGSPKHHENPYAFKIYAIDEAKKRGYTQVLWLDSSVWAIKTIEPLFDFIDADGYVCQEAGHYVGTWTNDRTLDYFGITRDYAMTIGMYGNAGLLGLDFETEIANAFFDSWKKSMLDGMFFGSWNNDQQSESKDPRCRGHRHDMSCGSIIRHNLNMKMKRGDEYLQYIYSTNNTPNNDTICLFAAGIRG